MRFVAESGVNGQPWTSMAEFNVLDGSGNVMDRSDWNVSADSEELNGEDGAVGNVVDGDATTLWHTEWATVAGDTNDPGHPHAIIIDFGAHHELSGFRYLPRQNSDNGTIRDYSCFVSTDGINWGSPVAQGTFAPDSTEKTVFF